MTAAAAIEEGVVTPSTVVEVPNRIRRADTEFKDSHDHPTEYLTFAGVLAQSSNIGTILAGEKVKAVDDVRLLHASSASARPPGWGSPVRARAC